ncbi:MAG: hypothetical protein LBV16_00625 [Elusimicrobiota bacterium]|jgi:photosystem II stability/assembly factor-like uncharacterized protein|nr:hypothetical protein [Elusimicrobiota bacterium]
MSQMIILEEEWLRLDPTNSQKLQRSTDGGKSWETRLNDVRKSWDEDYINKISGEKRRLFKHGDKIFLVTTYGGIDVYSSDNGRLWERSINRGLADRLMPDFDDFENDAKYKKYKTLENTIELREWLRIDPTNKQNLQYYAGGGGGWETRFPSSSYGNFRALLKPKYSDTIIFVCNDGEDVYYSENHGSDWTRIEDSIVMVKFGKELLRIDPTNKQNLQYSTDDGKSWNTRFYSSSYGNFRALLSYKYYVFLVAGGGVYRSSDHGISWDECEVVSKVEFREWLRIDPTNEQNLQYSTNDGESWETRFSSSSHGNFSALFEHVGEIILVCNDGGDVYYSKNHGSDWTKNEDSIVILGEKLLRIDPTNTNSRRLQYSTDGGKSWDEDHYFHSNGEKRDLFKCGDEIILQTDEYFYFSTDRGTSWKTDNRMVPLEGEWVRINPANSQELQYSTDCGESWNTRFDGSSFKDFLSLSKSHQGILVIKSIRDTYYSSEDQGRSWKEISEDDLKQEQKPELEQKPKSRSGTIVKRIIFVGLPLFLLLIILGVKWWTIFIVLSLFLLLIILGVKWTIFILCLIFVLRFVSCSNVRYFLKNINGDGGEREAHFDGTKIKKDEVSGQVKPLDKTKIKKDKVSRQVKPPEGQAFWGEGELKGAREWEEEQEKKQSRKR